MRTRLTFQSNFTTGRWRWNGRINACIAFFLCGAQAPWFDVTSHSERHLVRLLGQEVWRNRLGLRQGSRCWSESG